MRGTCNSLILIFGIQPNSRHVTACLVRLYMFPMTAKGGWQCAELHSSQKIATSFFYSLTNHADFRNMGYCIYPDEALKVSSRLVSPAGRSSQIAPFPYKYQNALPLALHLLRIPSSALIGSVQFTSVWGRSILSILGLNRRWTSSHTNWFKPRLIKEVTWFCLFLLQFGPVWLLWFCHCLSSTG